MRILRRELTTASGYDWPWRVLRSRADEGAAMFDVGAGFIARQQAQLGVVREAVRDGGLFGDAAGVV